MRADVEVREAGVKGLGVFALRDFRAGEFIFRRRYGKVVQNDDIGLLTADEQRHLCELDWQTSAVLLPPTGVLPQPRLRSERDALGGEGVRLARHQARRGDHDRLPPECGWR
jgi:hypothetical protein